MKSLKLLNSLEADNSLNLKKIELLKSIVSHEIHNGNNYSNSNCCDWFVGLVDNADDADDLELIENKWIFFNNEWETFCDFLGDSKNNLEYFDTYFDLFCKLKKEKDANKKVQILKTEFDWADDDKIKDLSEYF